MAEEEGIPTFTDEEQSLEYYSLFNVSKNASLEEIKRAYRRLCKIYHPDRYQDEHRQSVAAEMFPRIQEAYRVLSDSRLREIYDRRGKVGLAEDMAIVERTAVPKELLDEYEKLRALWEERTYIQNSNPTGDFNITFDATKMVDGTGSDDSTEEDDYESMYDDDDDDEMPIKLTGLSFHQSVSGAITKSDVGTVTALGMAKKLPTNQFSLVPQGGWSCESGLHFSLKHAFSLQNSVILSLLANEKPGLSVEVERELGWGVKGTFLGSAVVMPYGIPFSGMCVFRKNLSPSTIGIIKQSVLGNSSKLSIVHQQSSTVSYAGEIAIDEEGGSVKGSILYQPIPKYIFRVGMKMGNNGLNFKYGVVHKIAHLTTIGASVVLNPTTGTFLELKLSRAFMNFGVKIKLSEFVRPTAILYAMSVPLAIYGCIKAVSLTPAVQNAWLDDETELQQDKSKELAEKKVRAESAIELMQETCERIVTTEQARHGLLIVEAWYGKLFDQGQPGEYDEELKVIDVRVPLQCLVIDSKLILHETSKVDIHGFYDPCVGEKKYLRVRYEFRGMPHEVTVENSEPLIIPRPSHKLGSS